MTEAVTWREASRALRIGKWKVYERLSTAEYPRPDSRIGRTMRWVQSSCGPASRYLG
jgi:predicted DNA-binding transcriptional regulator AlpA